jgi:hypothetical protein
VLDPGERLGLAARVEHDERDRDLAEVQLVDQPVTGLTGQVPEKHLPGLRASTGNHDFLAVKCPDVAPVRRVGRLVSLPAEYQPESRLAHTRVAKQHHLGVYIPPRIRPGTDAPQNVVDQIAVDPPTAPGV